MKSSDIWALTNAETMKKEREEHPRFNDEFDNIIVDTCYVADCNYYECGVSRDGCWYIVEKNIPESKLKEVYDKWVNKMKENPLRRLYDMHSEEGDVLDD